MTLRFPKQLSLLPLTAAALIVLGGCGSSASGIHAGGTVAPAGTPLATVQPAPSPVISGGSVAAIVNGHSVPMSQYRLLVDVNARQSQGQPNVTAQTIAIQSMNQLVANEIVLEYAMAHSISISPSELQAEIKADEARTGGKKGLEQRLSSFGLSIPQFATLIQPSLLEQKVAQKIVPVSTAPQPVAQVRHILIMTHRPGKPTRTDAAAKALATKILNEVRHGANFAKLARLYSDDTVSGQKGGDLGTVRPHEMVPAFDHAVFTLPPHQPALVHSRYGYHVVEVLSRGTAPPSSTMRAQTQQAGMTTWLKGQIAKAKIQKIAKVSSK